jgi:Cytochrome P450
MVRNFLLACNKFLTIRTHHVVLSFSCRGILHDERVYKNPEEFNPERFLKDGQLDPNVRSPEGAAFGFGRRYDSYFVEHSCRDA